MEYDEIKKIHNELLNKRNNYSIKSDYGRGLIIAGSYDFPFSGLIVGKAALTTGCGYITYLMSSFNKEAYLSRAHLMSTFINSISKEDSFLLSSNFDSILKYDSISFGNGIKDSVENLNFLAKLLCEYTKTLIIDASGIQIFKRIEKNIILNKKCDVILTPHLLEADRLFDCNLKEERNSFNYKRKAIEYSKKYNVYILIKSHNSLLVYLNDYILTEYNTPSLAKAGSGDFLTGLLLGYLSYSKKNQLSIYKTIDFADSLFHFASKELEKRNKKGEVIIDDLYFFLKDF